VPVLLLLLRRCALFELPEKVYPVPWDKSRTREAEERDAEPDELVENGLAIGPPRLPECEECILP